ncbi:MAG TPA: amino acid ABC transporter permease [Actinomycetota bacterium]|nr:amino acid ABC transporter permease [Actinomycetota bacterium]
MATAHVDKPVRDLAWLREQSQPLSLAAFGLGVLSLAAVILGTAVVLLMHGLTPYENVVRGFKSAEMTGVGVWAVGLGVAASALGWGTFRRMPTKVSREEAVAGAVLGAQAAVLGAVVLWFSEGDVDVFAFNFFNFEGPNQQLDAFLTGAKNTLVLALSSELLGILLGLVLAIFAISKRAVVRAPARVYINFFRGTPLLWQLSFIGIGIPLGLGVDISTYTAGIIALSLNMGAYSAEVFRAGIQSIERGQLEAARGLGMSYGQAMRYSIVPQAVRRVIPPLMNEFVILVKDTSLVVFVGLAAGERELLSVASQGFGNTFNATFFIYAALGYLAICLPAIRLVNAVERRMRSGLVGVTA